MTGWHLFWAAWMAAFLVVETAALLMGGVTLSAVVWQLLGVPLWRPLVVSLVIWLIWHWMIEGYFPALRHQWRDDAAIASLAAVLSALLGRRR